MDGWKTWGKRLLFPSVWMLVLLSMLSTAALVWVFTQGMEEHPAAYAVYALSFYVLTADCVRLSRVIPKWHRGTMRRIRSNPVGERYLTNAAFRVRVSLYSSLMINAAYSIFKLIVGVVYGSLWWGAVAVYYILLALMRFVLLRYMQKSGENGGILYEFRCYRLCGILMLILNLSLSAIAVQMVREGKGYAYPGVMIFAVAAYTFYTVTISIADLIRYRKYKSPVISAAKAIRFAAALVSLLSMETAMLAQFGEGEAFRRLMTACTAAGVCTIVLGISVYMIVRANREIGRLKEMKKE